MSFDMPGTWENGKDIREFTTTNCLAAIDSIIKEVAKPACIVGHSNGGRLAVLAASRNPQVVALACIMSAATTYPADRAEQWQADGVKVSLRDDPFDPTKEHRFDLPFSFCQDAMQYNALTELQTLAIPKLFVAGQHDEIVTPGEISQTFKLAAKPKQLLTIDSDHDYRRSPTVIDQVNAILKEFLAAQGIITRPL